MTNNGEKKEQPFTVCFRCGWPLKKSETAAYFQGQYVKFFEHDVGTAVFYLCRECQEAADKFVKEGIRGSVHRVEEANKIDGPESMAGMVEQDDKPV